MDYLPLFTRVQGQFCLLVGSGGIALRKARLLAKAGAKIRCVSEARPGDELLTLIANSGGEYLQQAFSEALLQDARLVVVATHDDALAGSISEYCQQRQIPVNVVDRPELCSFIFPAMVDRSPLLVAVSSSGDRSTMAGKIKLHSSGRSTTLTGIWRC